LPLANCWYLAARAGQGRSRECGGLEEGTWGGIEWPWRNNAGPSKRFWRCLPAATTAASSSALRISGNGAGIEDRDRHESRFLHCGRPYAGEVGFASCPRL